MKIQHIHFKTIPSTNTWSKENAHLFDREQVTLVTADEQTAGRGRYRRHWVSPSQQNLYATFNFFVDPGQTSVGNIPQVLALAIIEVLTDLGLPAFIKWPNDVLLKGKKVAGILCETVSEGLLLCVVLGVGLNINMPQEILTTIDRPATSLLAESGKPHSREEILSQLIESFMPRLDFFLKEGFSPFYEEFCKSLIHKKGELTAFQEHHCLWKGLFHSISPDGSLNLILENENRVKNFVAGEIPW